MSIVLVYAIDDDELAESIKDRVRDAMLPFISRSTAAVELNEKGAWTELEVTLSDVKNARRDDIQEEVRKKLKRDVVGLLNVTVLFKTYYSSGQLLFGDFSVKEFRQLVATLCDVKTYIYVGVAL